MWTLYTTTTIIQLLALILCGVEETSDHNTYTDTNLLYVIHSISSFTSTPSLTLNRANHTHQVLVVEVVLVEVLILHKNEREDRIVH